MYTSLLLDPGFKNH